MTTNKYSATSLIQSTLGPLKLARYSRYLKMTACNEVPLYKEEGMPDEEIVLSEQIPWLSFKNK